MAEKHVHKVYGSFPPWGKSVEFPASGGGGNYVYFDTSSITERGEETDVLYSVSCILKENTEEAGVGIFNTGYRYAQSPPLAIGIDLNMRISKFDEEGRLTNEFTTMKEMLVDDGISWILDLPRLTEEEFYKIPTQFTFTLNGEPKKYYYYEGMTWGEWIDSPYNDGNFSVQDANMGEGIQEYVHYDKYSAISYNEGFVKPTDLIQPDINYIVNNDVG